MCKIINKLQTKYFLEKQGIDTIKKSNEENYIDMVRKFYSYKYKEYKEKEADKNEDDFIKKLKTKLVLLENEKLRSTVLSFVSEFGMIISVIIAIFSILFSIYGQTENIVYDTISYTSNVEHQIDDYQNKIDDISNKGKSDDEIKEYYNEKIDKISDKTKNLIDSTKDNINFNDAFIKNVSNITIAMLILFAIFLVIKLIDRIKFDSKNVEINIHKSVIEEILADIEKEKNNEKLINELKEIQKILIGNKSNISIFKKLIKK